MLEVLLSGTEKRHNIAKRWDVESKFYQDAKTILLQEKRKQLKTAMHSAVIRRQMLLDLKAKYAGMFVCKNFATSYSQ